MVDGIRPAIDPFGLGRLADTLRQGRLDEQNRQLQEQQAVTRGLQQEILGGQVQQQRQSLADLAAGRAQQADLQTALQQDTGQSNTLKAINFFESRNPQQAQELRNKTILTAGEMLKLKVNPTDITNFLKTEAGLDWNIESEDDETVTLNDGTTFKNINRESGDVLWEIPLSTTPTTLIKNLEAAGLKQGTAVFMQAVLSNLQQTGRTHTIEISPDGGTKITERVGPQEQKATLAQADAEKAEKKRTENAIEQATTVINKVDQVIEKVGLGTAGAGSLFSIIPGTPATDVAANIETLKANLAFNALQAMREASKTGGALGAVSERELSLLESQIASLNPKQSPEQLRQNLNEVKQSFTNMLEKAKQPAEPEPAEEIKVFNFNAQGDLIQ